MKLFLNLAWEFCGQRANQDFAPDERDARKTAGWL